MFGLTCESTERSRRRVVASAKGAKGGKKGGGGGGDDDDKPSKGGKGGDKGGGNSVDELAKIEKQTKADMAERTQKSLTALADNLNTIRTGRASASILDRILVTMEGSTMPLKSVAQISVPDASTLLIMPFDKSSLRLIEKALNESDIGINPSNDGERIRLAIPSLTEERRTDLAKKVSKYAEDGKIALRNVRTDVMKKVAKAEFSKDAKKDLETDIQKTLDAAVKKVEEICKAKANDIMKL